MLRNNLIIILAAFIISSGIGCGDCSYIIKADYIKSNCEIDGFAFNEIEVVSISNGVPDSVVVIRTIHLGLSEPNLKSVKKIFFYEKNDNYDWHDIGNASLTDILPIKMEIGRWYQIRGLNFLGQSNRAAFIKLSEGENLEVHGYSESSFY